MILIIGIGNPLRQDDGAGWALAQRLNDTLRALGCACSILNVQQLAPEHAVDIAAADVTTVCFVDVAVDAPGLRLVTLDAPGAPGASARLSHALGPTTLLAYAGTLRADMPTAWLMTVGGSEFGHGEQLSAAVAAALQDAAALHEIARRVRGGGNPA